MDKIVSRCAICGRKPRRICPALDNMTPRKAAADPRTRLKLIELMKHHLKGIEERNKDTGLNLNIDWVLDELALTELK